MNRTGKPTKAMQAQLKNWSPTFDLTRATNEERVSWRRLYTINWLDDLVNPFSSIVVQRNTMKGERHVYEDVDWSTTGPWISHGRLFGLNEFAGDITGLAMQKPNTDVRGNILPHHVFQLQCIVDSFAASRGWTLDVLRGHVLALPPRKFRPRRDVDHFLDREVQRQGQGLLVSIDVLKQILQKDADSNEDPNRHTLHSDIFEELKFDFVNWLAESKYMSGLTTIPASRFSKHNSNGLWEYSPLLCASGLVEGLVLVQRAVMHFWDKILETTLALHLHNMLVRKGYLEKEVGLYATLESLFEDSFFPEGVPDGEFYGALVARVRQRRDNNNSLRHRDMAMDIHQLLNLDFNQLFKSKSMLMMYYDADWVPERIPDGTIKIPSMLYAISLMNTERVVDSETDEKRLKETELIKHAKARGETDTTLLQAASVPILDPDAEDKYSEAIMRRTGDFKDHNTGLRRNPYLLSEKKKRIHFQGRPLLDALRVDVFADVRGNNPVFSLNYFWITCHIMLLFKKIEDQFREAYHPLWVEAYEHPPPQLRRQTRIALVIEAMASEDDEAMKLFAKGFEEIRLDAPACILWEVSAWHLLAPLGSPGTSVILVIGPIPEHCTF